MHRVVGLASLLALISASLIVPVFIAEGNHFSSADNPAYAKVGAYALYYGNGGSFPYLGGASANTSYYVYDVYPNGTMNVFVNVSLSLGTEVPNGTTTIAKNVTDSVYYPDTMPAISPANLSDGTLEFQNVTCTFVQNAKLTVPAGTFNATEYQGVNSNGTVHYWFDRATGLSLEMVESPSYIQLVQSNIAIPMSTPTVIQSELPFIVIFVVGWAGAGLFFYALIRHYTRRGKEPLAQKEVSSQ